MNRKIKYIIISLISIVIILLGIRLFIDNYLVPRYGLKEPIEPKMVIGRSIDDSLTPEEMREDLLQLKKDLEEIHPKTKDGLSEDMEKAFEEALKSIKEPMTVSNFTIIASELAAMLEDSHTFVIGNYELDLSLPMTIKIIGDEFYILEGKDLEPGDKLISLGGIPIEEMYKISKRRIPSENIYWTNYQFERYALYKSTLLQMGGEIEGREVEVVVNRNGENINRILIYGDVLFSPIETKEEHKRYKTYPEDNAYNPQFSYYMDKDNNLVHFILKSCEDSYEYSRFLEIMFEDIANNNIENIIVDLRGNPGGNARAINEFLKYIDVDEYVSFKGYWRLSQQASDQKGIVMTKGEFSNKSGKVKNEKVEGKLFQGDIYGLIDNGTYSAANWLGIVIKDTGIGTIIGEPSGNSPSFYGDILSFQLNNSKLIYTVSYGQFIRPDEKTRYDDALYPDFEVKYRLEDYLNNKDLTMEKAMNLIKSKGK